MAEREEPDAREQRRAETRGAILAAARELLVTGGYQAMSMRQIAEGVGCVPGTIYLYFEDKADLTRQLLQDDARELVRSIREVAGEDPAERLRGMVDAYLAFARESPHAYRLLFLTPGLPGPEQAEASGEVEAEVYAALTVGVAASLAARGRDSSVESVDAAAQLLWAGLHGLIALRLPGSPTEQRIPWQRSEELAGLLVTQLVGG